MSEEDEYFCPIYRKWEQHRTTEEELAFWLECNNFKLDEKHMKLYELEKRFRIWTNMPMGRFGLTKITIADWSRVVPRTPWRVTVMRKIHDDTYAWSGIHWNINIAVAIAINKWNEEVSRRCHPCEAHQFMIERRHITFC